MNLYKRFLDLLPQRPRQIGTVTSVYAGVAQIELLGGATTTAVGDAAQGQQVFIRDGAIEGPAPNLPVDNIEV